jgi:hypothetical protein
MRIVIDSKVPELRVPLDVMPYFFGDGEKCCVLPAKWVTRRDERFMGIHLITRRQQFGFCYNQLAGSYFHSMPNPSGVLVCPFVKTDQVVPGVRFPGDIDLLILPYEGNELVLSRAMAVELKVTRASFLKQDKSPNSFGFSQAGGLLAMGFPYVSVVHLITSDQSPYRSWREVAVTTVLDADGRIETPVGFTTDMLPADLMERGFRRLLSRSPHECLGLSSVYMEGEGIWMPVGKLASLNPEVKYDLMQRLADFYHRHPERFLLTPRFPLER